MKKTLAILFAIAVQLCGERRIASSRMALEAMLSDPDTPEILRRSARHSMSLFGKREKTKAVP